ncbi:MAG: hypothetical protein GY915_01280 [bacterium]|nr:hypothetical protein [bacterium]
MTPSRPEASKKAGSFSAGHPVAAMEAVCAPKRHRRPSASIWDRFGGDMRLILDP